MNNELKLPFNCIELPNKLGFLRMPNNYSLLTDFAETYYDFKADNTKGDSYFQARSSLITKTQYFYNKDRGRLFDESSAGILCVRENIGVLSGFNNEHRARISYLAVKEITDKVLFFMVFGHEDIGVQEPKAQLTK